MPPNVALTICLLLISALLIIESRQKVEVSHGLWIPLLWVTIVASRTLSLWLNPGEMYADGGGDYESGNPVDRIFFSALIGASLVVLARRKLSWGAIARENFWLMALILLAGASVLWSDFPGVSFKRWIRSFGLVLTVLIVLTEKDSLQALKRLFRRCIYVLIPLSVLFIKYFRHLGVGWDYMGNTMWYGVTTHKNSLGQLACVSAIFLIWNIAQTWKEKNLLLWGDLVILTMCLWLLNGSGMATSKTAIFLFFIGLTILIGMQRMRSNARAAGKGLILVVVVFIFFNIISDVFLGKSVVDMLIASSGRDETLTGRTLLWEELMRIAAQRPILGRGYGSFWIGNVHGLWDKFGWGPESAHNGLLDVYLELGVVGVVMIAGLVVRAYLKILRDLGDRFELGRFELSLLVMSVIYNYTESSFLRPSSLLWIVLLLVSVDRGFGGAIGRRKL